MQIDGTFYLFAQDDDGVMYVVQYLESEMAQAFSLRERTELNAGRCVVHPMRGGGATRYVNMVVTAYAAMRD